MASIAPSRLAALVKTRCTVFQTSYNPTSVRTGAKYLRARLRGPSMMNYYPPTLSLSSIVRQFPEMGLVDTEEKQRLQDIEDRKKRGKGAPKKAKTKGSSLVSRFAPILSPDLSSALFSLQPTVGVRLGSGREWAKMIFCGRLLVGLLSNSECINSTSRSTLLSISAWSSTVDPRAALHFTSSPFSSTTPHLPSKCLSFPSSPPQLESPPQTTTSTRRMALS
jgi:small subunit ribosomal protein S33